MRRWFHIVVHLLLEAGAARRDACIRLLKAQVEILRRKLGGNLVIPSPDDRARLLAIGQELDLAAADMIGVVTPNTWKLSRDPSPFWGEGWVWGKRRRIRPSPNRSLLGRGVMG